MALSVKKLVTPFLSAIGHTGNLLKLHGTNRFEPRRYTMARSK